MVFDLRTVALGQAGACGEERNNFLKPLTSRSDRYVNSPYNFNTVSCRQVMRNYEENYQ